MCKLLTVRQAAEKASVVPNTIDQQYRHRSASQWLHNARGRVQLSINTGITDGHDGSVPVGHTLRAFNAVADDSDAIDRCSGVLSFIEQRCDF